MHESPELSNNTNLPKVVNSPKSTANPGKKTGQPIGQIFEGLSKFLGFDFKESVFYRILLKCFKFYNIPNKTFDDWVGFLLELFSVVGHVSDTEL